MALLGIPKKQAEFLLRESDSACLFVCLNTFCSVGPASREDIAKSFSRIANP
jgi:hypothetical protein